MSLKFAILKGVELVNDNIKYELVLQYNQEQVIERLITRTKENIFNKLEREAAMNKAWSDLITEFKNQTIALP